jgi:hypothetical protein
MMVERLPIGLAQHLVGVAVRINQCLVAILTRNGDLVKNGLQLTRRACFPHRIVPRQCRDAALPPALQTILHRFAESVTRFKRMSSTVKCAAVYSSELFKTFCTVFDAATKLKVKLNGS